MNEGASRHVLEDLLRPGVRIVFCGTQAGRASALKRAYYAGPGNRFWPTLKRIGLIPGDFPPSEFRRLPDHGIGLTDIAKATSGPDAALRRHHVDIDDLVRRLKRCSPEFVAFNGKRAASEALGCDGRSLSYGPCTRPMAGARVFVLPSTSGAASGHWDERFWSEMAGMVGAGAP